MEDILADRSIIDGQPTNFSSRDDRFADLVVAVFADGLVPFDEEES